MHTAQGAGGLGYGLPAARSAWAAATGGPVLAVSGDGGAMYKHRRGWRRLCSTSST